MFSKFEYLKYSTFFFLFIVICTGDDMLEILINLVFFPHSFLFQKSSNSKNKDYKYINILVWEILRERDTQEGGHC